MTGAIYALATAPGRAAVAVVRLSGPGTRGVLKALCGGAPKPRRAALRALVGAAGEVLDRGLVLWFPAPASYTGDDCAELHLHGGPAVVEAVMGRLAGLGLRLAAPGEFTRRAFENGKLDLDQAEAVADLVDAETQAQARQALGQLAGALGDRHKAWRESLIEVLAYLEAAVDFPDEALPPEIEGRARPVLDRVLADIDAALADGARGRQVREGYRVAVIGAPNAGKSSLFNSLLGREAAIVAATAGTTRDVIEAPLVLGGYKVLLADMAGLRDATDAIEAEGVRRAGVWADSADLRVWVVDGAAGGEGWRQGFRQARGGDLCYLNKADRGLSGSGASAASAARACGLEVLQGAIVEDSGLPVRLWLAERVERDLSGADFPAITRLRHAALLNEAKDHFERALAMLHRPELAADDVRMGVRALGRITGVIGVEDVLDQVFSRFCIGK